ncbi:MAG TPA: FtsX-like permease family protein [Vicinamibacteria bacterium]|nr:FtsX-like permease family protein [Vicinamibacteria bacterium]
MLLPALLLLAAASAAPPPDILVSRTLLRDRELRVGDVVLLSADARGASARPFRIAGTYEPTPDPSRFTARRLEARLHLPDMLALRGGGAADGADDSVSAVNVALADPADAAAFTRELLARAPTVTVAPTSAGDDEHFVVIERFHLAISIVTVIGSTAFLLALMVIRADERREVAGLLRLLGVSRRRVLAQALVEGLCIAGAGAVFGVLFAGATQGAVNAFFQWRHDTTLVFVRVTPAIAGRCLALALPLGVLAGVFASWTLLRRPVLDLLRR